MSSAHDFYFVLHPFVACEFSLSQMFQSGTSPIQLTGCSCAGLLHAIMSMLAWSGSGKNRCCRIHARSSAGSAEEPGRGWGGRSPPNQKQGKYVFCFLVAFSRESELNPEGWRGSDIRELCCFLWAFFPAPLQGCPEDSQIRDLRPLGQLE